MKKYAALCLLILCSLCVIASAQDSSAATHAGWNYGLFAGYGNGVGQDSGFHRFSLGVRGGRVLMRPHGPGVLRGTFEWDVEATPVDILHYGESTYAASLNPIVWRWNFTGNGDRKTVPYFEAVGGALFSAEKFPAGDTSRVNFQSGAGIGVQHFVKPNRAVSFEVRALHISNASLGNHNPGVNAQLQFQVGYSWFK